MSRDSTCNGAIHSLKVLRSASATLCLGVALAGTGCEISTGPDRTVELPIAVSPISAGREHTCAVAVDGVIHCWGAPGLLGNSSPDGSVEPTPVEGSHRFVSVSAGIHTCALTAEGEAYCWGGLHYLGVLGTGSRAASSVPVRVEGDLRFSLISAGSVHTCGLTHAGEAFCWGSGPEAGPNTDDTCIETSGSAPIEYACVLTPSPVSWNVRMTSLGSSFSLVCAVSLYGDPYCWGSFTRPEATRIPSSVSLSTISTGNSYACGLSNSRPYCWGVNDVGQLGTTTTEHCARWGTCSTRMVPVDTDLEFAAISAGTRHVCGLTHSGAAYCWGQGVDGPVPVSGGHTFKALSAGLVHTCGITDAGEAYCWGENLYGQLGIGSLSSPILVPTRVAGEVQFMVP